MPPRRRRNTARPRRSVQALMALAQRGSLDAIQQALDLGMITIGEAQAMMHAEDDSLGSSSLAPVYSATRRTPAQPTAQSNTVDSANPFRPMTAADMRELIRNNPALFVHQTREYSLGANVDRYTNEPGIAEGRVPARFLRDVAHAMATEHGWPTPPRVIGEGRFAVNAAQTWPSYGTFYGPRHVENGREGYLAFRYSDDLRVPEHLRHTVRHWLVPMPVTQPLVPINPPNVSHQTVAPDYRVVEATILGSMSEATRRAATTAQNLARSAERLIAGFERPLTSTTLPPISSVVEQPNEALMLIGNRTFGVELEIVSPTRGDYVGWTERQLNQTLNDRGIECWFSGYNHTNSDDSWKVTTDATVLGGYELVSPILRGEEGLEQIRKVSAILIELGYKVNKTCGMHVHISKAEMSTAEVIKVLQRYARHEAEIDWMVAASRRGANGGAGYTRGLRRVRDIQIPDGSRSNLTVREVLRNYNGMVGGEERFFKVNLMSRHPTIEFRHHQGTIEADKIINWIKFCMAFVEASVAVMRGLPTFGQEPVIITRERTDRYPDAESVMKAIKRTYRRKDDESESSEPTKSFLVAQALLQAEAGLTRDQLSEIVGQERTQISVILQHFKEKKFGLVQFPNPTHKINGDRCKFRYRIMVGPDRIEQPAPPPAESWKLGVPQPVVQFLETRQKHFKQLAGILTDEPVVAASEESEAA